MHNKLQLFKVFFQYFFSKSNIFFAFLLCLVLINCRFAFITNSYINALDSKLDSKFVGEIRIIQEDKQQFGYRYNADTSIGNIFIESKDKLNIGYKYFIQGDLVRFKLDQFTNSINTENNIKLDSKPDFDLYYISTGKIGRIKNPNILKKLAGCDFECIMFQKISGFRYGMSSFYDQQICKNLDWINNFFQNPCILPLAWANGLVIGNGDLFDKFTKDNIKKLGLTHLIVVSGMQVSLVFVVLEFLFLKISFKRKTRWLLCFLGIFVLILVVGFQPPVLRSSISIFFSTFSLIILGRRLNPFRSLGYSAMILLVLNPFFIVSYSFWLSFVATFGLIIATSLDSEIDPIPELDFILSFKEIALTTLIIFLYTLPLIVNLSGGISPIALITNLIAIPVINVVTIFNILGFIPYIGELFLVVSTTIQNILIVIFNEFLPYAQIIKMQSFGIFEIIIYWFVLSILMFIVRIGFFDKTKIFELIMI